MTLDELYQSRENNLFDGKLILKQKTYLEEEWEEQTVELEEVDGKVTSITDATTEHGTNLEREWAEALFNFMKEKSGTDSVVTDNLPSYYYDATNNLLRYY